MSTRRRHHLRELHLNFNIFPLRNLEVSIDPSDHEELLELLWGLGKGVDESLRGQAAGHQELRRSPWSTPEQSRRFHLQNTV